MRASSWGAAGCGGGLDATEGGFAGWLGAGRDSPDAIVSDDMEGNPRR